MGREGIIADVAQKLSFLLERLPIAVALIDASGNIIGKSGQLSGILGAILPSRDPEAARRWRFEDSSGATIAPCDWPSARALRGEHLPSGLIGRFQKDGEHLIRVTSIPVARPNSGIVAVSFLQQIDRPTRSADGSHSDLEYRIIEALKLSVSEF